MKTFVVFASCLAITSVAGRGNGSGGGGGYSDSGASSGGSSGSGGYSGASGGGNSFGLGGSSSSGQFGSSGLTMSALMNLLGGGGGFGQNSNGGIGGGSGFGRQSGSSAGGYDGQSGTSGGVNGGAGGAGGGQQGGQVRRFVSVHVAPQDDAPREARVIRAGGAPDTHVNIIFVKAPSGASEQQTEVVLPEPPKQKTLVYVLIKRPTEGENNVKIRAPAPTKPPKPEVYFIRYKPDSEAGGVGGSVNAASGDGGVGVGNGFGGATAGGFGGFPSGGGNNGLTGNALGSSYGAPSQLQDGGDSSAGGYQ